MPDGYVTGSGGMSYCNQTLFLFGRVGSGHETTHAHALIIHHRKIFVHLIFAAKATGEKFLAAKISNLRCIPSEPYILSMVHGVAE